MKRFLLIFLTLLMPARALASIEPLHGYRDSWQFDTLANAAAFVGLYPGYIVECADTKLIYEVFPAGTYTCSSPHCSNGQGGIQLVDEYTRIASYITGASVPLVTNTTQGSVPAVGAAGTMCISTGTGCSWNFASNSSIASNAAIDPGKFAVCLANQVIASNGTADACTTMTDGIHNTLSGTNDHALATNSRNGFLMQLPATGDYVLVTNGPNQQWTSQIGGAYILDGSLVASKLTAGAANSVVWSNGTTAQWSQGPTLATSLTIGLNAAASGLLRLPNGSGIIARNGANSGDQSLLFLNSSNAAVLGGVTFPAATAVTTSGQLVVVTGAQTLGVASFSSVIPLVSATTPGLAPLISGPGAHYSADGLASQWGSLPVSLVNGAVSQSRAITTSSGITVNGTTSDTLLHDVALSLVFGTDSTHPVVGNDSRLTVATGTHQGLVQLLTQGVLRNNGTIQSWINGPSDAVLSGGGTGQPAFKTIGGDISGPIDAVSVTKLKGADVPSSPGAGAVGYIMYVPAPGGYAIAPPSVLGLLTSGSPIVFDTGVLPIQITQATTSGAAHDFTIQAQSSTTNSFFPADLILNAGTNVGGGIGAIQLGYAGNTGAFGTVANGGAFFRGSLSTEDIISAGTSGPGSETHVVTRNSGFGASEDIQWFVAFSSSTAPVSFDVTTWLGSPGIPDGHVYHATYEIAMEGSSYSTITAVGTWKKSSGTLIAWEGLSGINGLGITVGASNPTNDTMRLQVTPQNSTTTTWTAKVHIIQN